MSFIPVNEPLFGGNEKKYLNECIDTGWISSEGRFVKDLEQKFADLTRQKYGIAVSSGSGALDIALKALKISDNDEVIMPAFTIISCATAIVQTGAKPVLIDAMPDSYTMNIKQIEKKITHRTKAIMVVHIYGLPVDMQPVIEIAQKYNLPIIEDAAEAHGLYYKDKPCGSFGTISIFSFYPNKLVTTGEGGMLVTSKPELAERCKSLRNLCFQPEKRFVHQEIGWNYRMSNLQAAVGVAQLEQIAKFIKRKREIGQLYTQLLSENVFLQLPVSKTEYAENIFWVYPLILTDSFAHNADFVMKKLKEKAIGTRPFFYPMHLQPVFNKMNLFIGEKYPVSEKIAERGFYVPAGLAITNEQIKTVVQKIEEVFDEIK